MAYTALARANVTIELFENEDKYEAVVVSTNGVILQPYDTSTTLIGTVLKNNIDITKNVKNIKWTKWNPTSDNLLECEDWNKLHTGSSTITVSKEDVDSKSIFTFEAYDNKDNLLCSASISIIDINDLLASTVKPINPYVGQLWIDDSTDPATLYIWNGYKWVVSGAVGAVVKNLLKNTGFLFNCDKWDIVGDTRLMYTPTTHDYLDHRFLKLNSDELVDSTRGISQTTTDYIAPKSNYSFQMLYYSKEDSQSYSNNINIEIYSVDSSNNKMQIYSNTITAEEKLKKLFVRFKSLDNTKHFMVKITGENKYRFDFNIAEPCLYNTHNEYPWTIHPSDNGLSLDQETLWNIFSNNNTAQGIFSIKNKLTGQLDYYINATYIGAGKMKAEYLDAYNLRVLRKDDNTTTLEITDNGDVNLRVNTLIINSANKTIEDMISQIYIDQSKIELKIENYKEELSSKITQTAEQIRAEVKDAKEDLESSITQTATEIRAEVKDINDGLNSTISQTATEIRAEIKNVNDNLNSTISQTAEQIRAEVKDVDENLTSAITQTASQIRAEVSDVDNRLTSSITQTATNIRSEVSSLDEKLTSNITQTAKEINLKVEDNTKNINSLIGVTADGIYLDSNGSLVNINGDSVTIKSENVTVDASNIHLEGYTTINKGFSIDKEGNMTANNGVFKGTISGKIPALEELISGSGNFLVNKNGILEAQEAIIHGSITAGSTITGSTIRNTTRTFEIDREGNIRGGSININDKFKVDKLGNMTATSANIVGNINAGSVVNGATIYIPGKDDGYAEYIYDITLENGYMKMANRLTPNDRYLTIRSNELNNSSITEVNDSNNNYKYNIYGSMTLSDRQLTFTEKHYDKYYGDPYNKYDTYTYTSWSTDHFEINDGFVRGKDLICINDIKHQSDANYEDPDNGDIIYKGESNTFIADHFDKGYNTIGDFSGSGINKGHGVITLGDCVIIYGSTTFENLSPDTSYNKDINFEDIKEYVLSSAPLSDAPFITTTVSSYTPSAFSCSVSDVTKTGFTLYCNSLYGSPATIYWMAIGPCQTNVFAYKIYENFTSFSTFTMVDGAYDPDTPRVFY